MIRPAFTSRVTLSHTTTSRSRRRRRAKRRHDKTPGPCMAVRRNYLYCVLRTVAAMNSRAPYVEYLSTTRWDLHPNGPCFLRSQKCAPCRERKQQQCLAYLQLVGFPARNSWRIEATVQWAMDGPTPAGTALEEKPTQSQCLSTSLSLYPLLYTGRKLGRQSAEPDAKLYGKWMGLAICGIHQ